MEFVIHVVAGCRMETLLQGGLEAGTRTVLRDGAGVRDDDPLSRLTIGGRIDASGVALLKNGR